DPRDYSYAIHRYRKEVTRLYGVLERQLEGREYVCDDYSVADIASWTWVGQYNGQLGGLKDFPNISAWHARISEGAAVKRGMTVWMPESDEGWSAAGNAVQIAQGSGKQQAT